MLKLRNSSEICFPSPACFRQISISNIHFKLENTNIKNSCLKYLNVQLKPSYCPSTSSSLTTPFWTLKPSWYLVSGLLILTSTTGGHETAVSFTAVFVLQFWNKPRLLVCCIAGACVMLSRVSPMSAAVCGSNAPLYSTSQIRSFIFVQTSWPELRAGLGWLWSESLSPRVCTVSIASWSHVPTRHVTSRQCFTLTQ